MLAVSLLAVGAGALASDLTAPRGDEPDSESRSPRASDRPQRKADPDRDRIEWRDSAAIGLPHAGRLNRGVQLPVDGREYVTWDPIERTSPNRPWRRWGSDRLLRRTLGIVRAYAKRHPGAEPLVIGDLSRPRGGDFGPRYGPPGHGSHQNGLDIDVYYPRKDRKHRPPNSPAQVDRELAQDLVDLWVKAGAEKVFVGPSTGLRGPPGVVAPLVLHDDHLHARIPG